MPKQAKPVIQFDAAVEIQAAAGDGDQPTFSVLAYTGGAMEVAQFDRPIVVDLAGMKFSRSLVANLDHDAAQRVGHITQKTKEGGQLVLAGVASAATEARREVIESAGNGFVWQASIEAKPHKIATLAKNRTRTVNGQTVTGPAYVIETSLLKGFAFVSHGADDATEVAIAAQSKNEDSKMDSKLQNFIEEMLPGVDVDQLSAEALANLKANYEGRNGSSTTSAPKATSNRLEAKAAEQARCEALEEIACKFIDDPHRAGQAADIKAAYAEAVEAQWSPDRFRLALYERTTPAADGQRITPGGRHGLSGDVLEAAICTAGGMEQAALEKTFGEKTLEAAHKNFRNGIGLRQLFVLGAQANGHAGGLGGEVTIETQRAAFGLVPGAPAVRASMFSGLDLSGILSNVANKFLMQGFNAVESAWRDVSSVVPVRDFKQRSSYVLHGDWNYKKVGPDGEIKHGVPGETKYVNQADTYARMFAITRQDIINDDLGALSEVPRKLGRGAGLAINEIFWQVFLDNAGLYPVNDSNNNYLEGADTELKADGIALEKAEVKFRDQTDPDGNPLGSMPRVMLVPSGYLNTALRLVNSRLVVGGDSPAVADTNIFEGRYRVSSSVYMSNANYTGNSAKAWYLLADPADISTIEVCFLNGREAPVVETADADFNTLGVQMRGYHDFGVSPQEFRGGVKSKGEA